MMILQRAVQFVLAPFGKASTTKSVGAVAAVPSQPQTDLTFDQWIEAEIQKVLRNPEMVAKDPNDGPAVAAARRHELGRIRRLESMRDPGCDEDDY